MLSVRALSDLGRAATIAVDRRVATPAATFSPLPNRAPAPIVFALAPVAVASQDWAAHTACRSYLSEGLADPGGYLVPRGWLLDVRA